MQRSSSTNTKFKRGEFAIDWSQPVHYHVQPYLDYVETYQDQISTQIKAHNNCISGKRPSVEFDSEGTKDVNSAGNQTTDVGFDIAFTPPTHAAEKSNSIVRKRPVIESDDEEPMDVEQEGFTTSRDAEV